MFHGCGRMRSTIATKIYKYVISALLDEVEF
jgi:hypothetical protein